MQALNLTTDQMLDFDFIDTDKFPWKEIILTYPENPP